MHKWLAFGAVFAALPASVVYAQDLAVGDDITQAAPESTDVILQDFSDTTGSITRAYAASEGIDEKEAAKQLRAMRKADRVSEKLRRKYGADFVGLEYMHVGGKLKIKALKASLKDKDKDDSNKIAKDEGLEYEFSVSNAALSLSQAESLSDRIRAVIKPLDPSADFSLDKETGDLTIIGERQLVDPALLSFVPGKVSFKRGNAILAAENLIAGSAWNGKVSASVNAYCTMGFKALSPSGATGAITAGHCDQNSPAEFNPFLKTDYGASSGRKLLWKAGDQWIGNGLDVQFHTLGNSDDSVRAYYYNGEASAPIYSTASTYPAEGDYFCFFGRKTNKFLCGYVGKPRSSAGYGSNFYTVLSSGRGPLAQGGDSGGPVVMGDEAKGIIHAYDGVTGDLIFNDLLSMKNKAGLKFYALTR